MNEKIKKILESKTLRGVLYGIGIILIATLIFCVGISVGFHQASFGESWSEHYNDNFGMGNHSTNAHGAIGKIIKLQLPNIIVEDKDNTEKVILIADDTIIEKQGTGIKSADLQLNDFVVVIGSPNNQGQIEAKLIRVIPLPTALTQ